MTELAKDIRHYIRPYFLKTSLRKRFYDIASVVSTVTTLHYVIVAFVLLRFNDLLVVWGSFYWIGNILILVLFFYFRFLHPLILRHLKKNVSNEIAGSSKSNDFSEEASLKKKI